jgi:hypothetical protein
LSLARGTEDEAKDEVFEVMSPMDCVAALSAEMAPFELTGRISISRFCSCATWAVLRAVHP